MKGTKAGIGSVIAAVALLALAPNAVAVSPQTATANYDCGIWGGGSATLTATEVGSVATIKLSTALTAPIAISANSLTSDLALTLNGGSTQTHFTGTVNPAMAAGAAITVGPLTGTVASGDSLDSYLATGSAYSLSVLYLGVTVTCKATTAQVPGPFVF
jgi:hypothetical protein